jgi:hypothetical protein
MPTLSGWPVNAYAREHFLLVGQRLNEHWRTAGATERAFTYARSLVHGEHFALE